VQLGAFSEADNAEAARARLMQTWDKTLPLPEIAYVGKLYRLHSGPFASRTEAAEAAQRVQASSALKPLVVQH
jgi:rare lipoprotein A